MKPPRGPRIVLCVVEVTNGACGTGDGWIPAEELLDAFDRARLDLVDELATAVVAPAGVPLRVLVRQDGPLRFPHRPGNEVLRRDELETLVLPLLFVADPAGDVRIDDVEVAVEECRRGGSEGRGVHGDACLSGDLIPSRAPGTPRCSSCRSFRRCGPRSIGRTRAAAGSCARLRL